MVDVNGNFIVDVFVFLVEGVYSVEVMVSDEVGNSIIVIDNIGVIDMIVFILLLDILVLDSDIIFIILGNIDLFVGVMVMIIVMDNVGVS